MANDRDAEPDAEPNGENADELSKVGEMSFLHTDQVSPLLDG